MICMPDEQRPHGARCHQSVKLMHICFERIVNSGMRQNQATWFSRVGSSFRGTDSRKPSYLLFIMFFIIMDIFYLVSLELQGLEALEFQMSRNLEALRERREAGKFAGTFKGMVFNLAGRLFMTYCMLRVLTVSPFK